MILYVHGGPNGQDNYSFNFARQWFAANGYTVISPNYRGSSGRGAAYQRAIFADWGHLEVLDLMGAVDEAVRSGIADSIEARDRRLELRRHPHRLFDRDHHALQGGRERRRQREPALDVRRR